MLRFSSTLLNSVKYLASTQRTSLSNSNGVLHRKYKFYFPFMSSFTMAAYFSYNSIEAFCDKAKYSEEFDDNDTETLDIALPNNSKVDKWTLYQYATCPFCCKVRAFLNYYDMQYEIVEVNPLFRKEIKFSDYRKVPILKSDNFQLNDSSLIISILKSHLLGKADIGTLQKYYPKLELENEKGKQVVEYQNRYNVMYMEGFSEQKNISLREEHKWRKWVDDTFVHTLSPNIYRTMTESFQAMDYFTHVGNFSAVERQLVYYSGALAMYVIGKRVKKKYRLDDDVRKSLYTEAKRWTKAVGTKRKYLGGKQPNLADLNMYGVISAIEGLDAFNDLMKNTDIEPWYRSMKHEVESHNGAKQTDWLVAQ